MPRIAIAIVCNTPAAGTSKTRLSPPLRPDESAEISSCFIRDLSRTIQNLAGEGDVAGYAVYTPLGPEAKLRRLLPDAFNLMVQGGGDLGARLAKATADLLAVDYDEVILVNSDSPTLPIEILRQGDNVILSPAFDDGYTLIGLSRPHPQLFEAIPWGTKEVYRLTLRRVRDIELPVINVSGRYDVDDAESLRMLEDEFVEVRPAFTEPHLDGTDAPATRKFIRERHSSFSPAGVAR